LKRFCMHSVAIAYIIGKYRNTCGGVRFIHGLKPANFLDFRWARKFCGRAEYQRASCRNMRLVTRRDLSTASHDVALSFLLQQFRRILLDRGS
jgi:hypothetical protein